MSILGCRTCPTGLTKTLNPFASVNRLVMESSRKGTEMRLDGKTAIVVGGSRGLGLGIAQALAANGSDVTSISRGATVVEESHKIKHRSGDAIDSNFARSVITELNPDFLVVSAGAPPHMEPINSISWEDFSNTWNSDVRAALSWIQSVLETPMKADSRVLIMSSGAAINGSPFSGGYGGAKRMIWLMADYAQKWSDRHKLGITFQTLVPRQMFDNTGVGNAGAAAYSRDQGISVEQFLSGFGKPLSPLEFGQHIVTILEDDSSAARRAFAISGDTGVVPLEGVAPID